ncbi:MAG: Molybdopterin-synthase adenylyltransferase [Firmicutes bacterium]|nr:Molybdopterin-synthase adenylyltransferase [candidate division NPL-UPA2 bacterium]
MERYSRQIAFPCVGKDGQAKLGESKVTVVGCGALGTVAAELLVRGGVGSVQIVDRDIVELSNLQRQFLYTERDAAERLPKALALAAHLKAINSSVEIHPVVTELTGSKAVSLLRGSTVVLDATDNYVTRFTINDACLELKLPWVYGGALGSRGMTATFQDHGACFRCLFSELPALGAGDSCELEGVLASATAIVAALQVAAVMKLIIEPNTMQGCALEFDVWKGSFHTIPLERDDRCPACKEGQRLFLADDGLSQTSFVCGRNSVLVRAGCAELDLAKLARVLAAKGLEVRQTKFSLRVEALEREIVLFADGRALVNGTSDAQEARRVCNAVLGS